ncbi:hypothetical protein PISMIDRAFT_679373 [Pisolithus microcarpus 441]|uniref:Uncharacterized protein n=1 Tax=Pisolithus microcarpus 441 TaxID=765257 RepID=A0A0C9YEX2_9AGAM|nr:hypothetical protein PISMIDRAFT_679373 [Pisolithus microcarpus 441]
MTIRYLSPLSVSPSRTLKAIVHVSGSSIFGYDTTPVSSACFQRAPQKKPWCTSVVDTKYLFSISSGSKPDVTLPLV